MSSRTRSALWRAFGKWNEDDGFLLSAAMAYYAAFSLLPLCLVLPAALGFAATLSTQLQTGQAQLLSLVDQHAGPWLAKQIEGLLSGVKDNARVSGPIGLLMLSITAAGMFAQLERILDRIWDAPLGKTTLLGAILRIVRNRAMAFGVLLVVGALLVATLVGNVVLSAIRARADIDLPFVGLAWLLAQAAMVVALDALLLAVVYLVLPKRRVAWRHALAGGLLVAIVWEIGKYGFEFVVLGDYVSIYGLIGSFMAVLLWVYYLSAAVFFGAEYVVALDEAATLEPRQDEAIADGASV